jgi:3'(2'), 5'-bisphosphate nucleotidase
VAEALPDDLREGVIAVARDAARAILDVYGRDFDVDHKADASPLTEADMAAHHCIVSGLKALTPDIPVLSEESAHAIPAQQRLAWPRLWLVDPLDGTREFVKRNDEFCINIALVEDGVARFGLVLAPVGGTLWHGTPGAGAFRRDHDGEHAIATRRPAAAPLRVAASRSHPDPRTAELVRHLGDIQAVTIGSALKFCLLAEGRMDVYPRFAPTSEWDTAAGQALVEAAGGAVLDPGGRPLRYNCRGTLLNGDFIALGDAALPWQSWLRDR